MSYAYAYSYDADWEHSTAVQVSNTFYGQNDLSTRAKEMATIYHSHRGVSSSWFFAHRRQALIDGLESLRRLEADWDGEGAFPISHAAIELATRVAADLPVGSPIPDFSPNPNGTLSFYWDLAGGKAELEVGRTRYAWAILDESGTAAASNSSPNESASALMELLGKIVPRVTAFENHSVSLQSSRPEWDDALMHL